MNDRPDPEVRFNAGSSRLAPPGGVLLASGLVALCMLGVGADIYRWIAHQRAPSLAVLYIPMLFLLFLRRAVAADDGRAKLLVSWLCALGAYYLLILAIAMVEPRSTSMDRWFLTFAVLNVAAVGWRLLIDRRSAPVVRSDGA
jgi:hypothetical protein